VSAGWQVQAHRLLFASCPHGLQRYLQALIGMIVYSYLTAPGAILLRHPGQYDFLLAMEEGQEKDPSENEFYRQETPPVLLTKYDRRL
jgi:hypothetical protein